jgi:hypothetical protein
LANVPVRRGIRQDAPPYGRIDCAQLQALAKPTARHLSAAIALAWAFDVASDQSFGRDAGACFVSALASNRPRTHLAPSRVNQAATPIRECGHSMVGLPGNGFPAAVGWGPRDIDPRPGSRRAPGAASHNGLDPDQCNIAAQRV